MLFARYHFICHLENDAILPPYKGSTFKGVFGRALKQVVCALKKQECDQCLHNEKCVYALVFETPACVEPPGGIVVSEPPHPFVIEPPLTKKTHFPKGSSFDFFLLLFGDINNNLPYFVYALDQMGEIGIGRRINGKRGRFTLQEVRAGGQTVYSGSERVLHAVAPLDSLDPAAPAAEAENSFRIKLILDTPLRFKFKDRLATELPFHVLTRPMLRRASALLSCYGDGNPPLDYRGLVERAEKVRIFDSDIRWFDWRRYSFRQKKGMVFGGMIGSITYEGKIGEYMPLIDFCSKVHLGKQTSFGLGKIRVEEV